MRLKSSALALFLAAATMAAATSLARAQYGTCEQLWVERNSIYKMRGYCFKTARAISYFGNAGCLYDVEAQVPLTRDERARIAEIVRLERAYGCN